jgi:proteasome alpha subunit
MSTPFYVSPEQLMKDKSDYARKGIARGRSVLTLAYADGILFVGENPSNALHKISEIYDRIAFAAVGKYNEFENLRLAGVRYADLRGYQYDRRDVTAAASPTRTPRRSARSSPSPASRTRWRSSSPRWGSGPGTTSSTASPTTARSPRSTATSSWAATASRSRPSCASATTRPPTCRPSCASGVEALGQTGPDGTPRTIAADDLEAAVLDRTRPRRAFSRLVGPRLERLLGQETPTA